MPEFVVGASAQHNANDFLMQNAGIRWLRFDIPLRRYDGRALVQGIKENKNGGAIACR